MAVAEVCCVCGQQINGYGNNAEPLMQGRCCDNCNITQVVRLRMQELPRAKEKPGSEEKPGSAKKPGSAEKPGAELGSAEKPGSEGDATS